MISERKLVLALMTCACAVACGKLEDAPERSVQVTLTAPLTLADGAPDAQVTCSISDPVIGVAASGPRCDGMDLELDGAAELSLLYEPSQPGESFASPASYEPVPLYTHGYPSARLGTLSERHAQSIRTAAPIAQLTFPLAIDECPAELGPNCMSRLRALVTCEGDGAVTVERPFAVNLAGFDEYALTGGTHPSGTAFPELVPVAGGAVRVSGVEPDSTAAVLGLGEGAKRVGASAAWQVQLPAAMNAVSVAGGTLVVPQLRAGGEPGYRPGLDQYPFVTLLPLAGGEPAQLNLVWVGPPVAYALRPGRLAIFQHHFDDPTDAVLVDPDGGERGDLQVQGGLLTDPVQRDDGSLAWLADRADLALITLSPSEETTAIEDLGLSAQVSDSAGDTWVAPVWLSPDARYFAREDPAGLHVRFVGQSEDAWTVPYTQAPLLARGQVVLTYADHLEVRDAATGAVTWSVLASFDVWPLTDLRLASDALVVAQDDGVATYGLADGQLRFAFHMPTALGKGWRWRVSEDGELVASNANYLVRLTTLLPGLRAPPTACSHLDCGSGETDLATDPNNCGGCGHVCPSAACSFGACR